MRRYAEGRQGDEVRLKDDQKTREWDLKKGFERELKRLQAELREARLNVSDEVAKGYALSKQIPDLESDIKNLQEKRNQSKRDVREDERTTASGKTFT